MLKQACSLAIRRVWNRRDIWSRCWDVAERWFQGWACDILETATRLFSFLAFKWLPLVVITALYENTWSIHSGFQVLHLETSHCLVSPCTLLPPCLLDCRLGGRKLQGRSIHCPEAFQAPPWTGKAPVVLHLHVSELLLELTLLPPSTFRRSGTSLESESDGNTWRCRSHSDELLQSMGSSPSTDSFLMEGEKKMHLHLLVFPWAFAIRNIFWRM